LPRSARTPEQARVAVVPAPRLDVTPIAEYQAANAHVFPSLPAWRWYWRQHRKRLVQDGAVIVVGGRHYATARMNSTVEAIARERAARAAG